MPGAPGRGPMPGMMGGPGGPGPGGGPASVPNLPGSWPRFRGNDFDNIYKESVTLARTWPAGGPKKLWSVKLGEGYAGPAVQNSRVYVLDYDQVARADVLRCLALADGRELWHQSYPVEVKRNHGMSRTTPALSGKYVVTVGPKCHVMCCNAESGQVVWKIDMVAQWGATVPQWYAGQCPLIDGNRVILAPGGSALMVAVDLASGKVVWQTPNPKGWKMTHASIIPATIGGKKLYLWPASLGVVGVTTDGKLAWETGDWRVSTATVPSAVPIGDGRVFFCGGYNSGAIMFRLTPQGAGFTSQVLYRLPATVFGSEQQTPILYQQCLYGVISSGQLVCLGLDGRVMWTSGPTRRYGLGPYILAGGLMYLIDNQGTMTLAEVSPQAFRPLATAKVLAGPDAWGPIAIAGGRLLCRDLTNMICLDVTGR
jgi:outer membrane protein assembly factor BamB